MRAILEEWRAAGRELYAAVFDPSGMRTCAGRITAVDDHEAVISDAESCIAIPYATSGDASIAEVDQRTSSVTLTWRDGTSAFLVTRR